MEEEIKIYEEETKDNYDDEANNDTTSGNRSAIILSYIWSWIGGLIVFLLEKQNRFIKWHALQGLILGVFQSICMFIISSILGLIPYIGWYFFSWLGYVLAGISGIFGIVALIMGCMGKTFRIPGASKLADRWFKM